MTRPLSGYSGTPLPRKLGIKEGSKVVTLGAPANYRSLVAPLPDNVSFGTRVTTATDLVHAFVTRRNDLGGTLASVRASMRADAAIWVSWPKKASKLPTDITEDTIRAVALPLGLVDTKVCAVDETWSGLKLVVRKENR